MNEIVTTGNCAWCEIVSGFSVRFIVTNAASGTGVVDDELVELDALLPDPLVLPVVDCELLLDVACNTVPVELLEDELLPVELDSWLEAEVVASVELLDVTALTPCVDEAVNCEVLLVLPLELDVLELLLDPCR